jgi:hypothetical protein
MLWHLCIVLVLCLIPLFFVFKSDKSKAQKGLLAFLSLLLSLLFLGVSYVISLKVWQFAYREGLDLSQTVILYIMFVTLQALLIKRIK